MLLCVPQVIIIENYRIKVNDKVTDFLRKNRKKYTKLQILRKLRKALLLI